MSSTGGFLPILNIYNLYMNLSKSFRNFEESRRHMPRNNPAAYQNALYYQLLHIIKPTGLGPFEFERQYKEWLKRRRNLRNHAANRMRAAASARRTRAMREQLGSVKVQTGSSTENGISANLLNKIESYMRRRSMGTAQIYRNDRR